MKKLSLVLALVFVLSIVFSAVSFAHVNGQREQYEWTVPKINPENPAINFDGIVDLEGELNGALCVSIDLSSDSDTYEEVTLWPQGVWSGSFNFDSYDAMDPMWEMTINTYFLWDENGLYMASRCDDSKVEPRGGYTLPNWLEYWTGAAESYDGVMGPRFEPMICGSDSADAYVNDPDGRWPTFFMGTIPAGEPAWSLDFYGSVEITSNDKSHADKACFDIASKTKQGSYLATSPDENGCYPFSQECFIPWDEIGGLPNGSSLYGNVVISRKQPEKCIQSFSLTFGKEDDGLFGIFAIEK